jgi:hypothetical protein
VVFMGRSFRDSLKVLEADIQHANSMWVVAKLAFLLAFCSLTCSAERTEIVCYCPLAVFPGVLSSHTARTYC